LHPGHSEQEGAAEEWPQETEAAEGRRRRKAARERFMVDWRGGNTVIKG
jgi:hypothetical protein